MSWLSSRFERFEFQILHFISKITTLLKCEEHYGQYEYILSKLLMLKMLSKLLMHMLKMLDKLLMYMLKIFDFIYIF